MLLAGCAPPAFLAPPVFPARPTATPLPPAALPTLTPATLGELVRIERTASIEGNLPLLAALWAEDARMVDGRGTPDPADDYIWQGRAAILSRYTLAVFPAPPPPLNAADLAATTLTLSGGTATLVNGGDRWRMIQRSGRWWLLELVYSAPENSAPENSAP